MYLTRHSDMVKNIDLTTPISIIGAGSIGSYSCLALAKLGFTNITVSDDGIVEEENIAPQLFKTRDIGKLKVDCLKRMIKEQTNTDIIAIPVRITVENIGILINTQLMVMAVDSMSAREMLFANSRDRFIVDARMAIEFLTVISICRDVIDQRVYYSRTLFDDADAVAEPCTNKAISYTSLIAGGLVAKTVMNCLANREPTYYKAYKAQTLNFDINNFDMVRLVCNQG